jgi:hypothetical protein
MNWFAVFGKMLEIGNKLPAIAEMVVWEARHEKAVQFDEMV